MKYSFLNAHLGLVNNISCSSLPEGSTWMGGEASVKHRCRYCCWSMEVGAPDLLPTFRSIVISLPV